MDWYKISLQLAAPTPTPWHADTLFGHLCWALAHMEGAGFLETFLGLYELDAPPLVLSNGFPGDLLPRPLLMARPQPAAADPAAEQEGFRRRKEVRRAVWLSPAEFERARRGEPVQPAPSSPFTDRVTMHNSINRLTATTGEEGGLYVMVAQDPAKAGGRITIYALVDPGFVDCLRRCLAYLAVNGYGKRKSVGYGAIVQATLEPFAGFAPPANANGFIALSNFVPAAGDPTQGAWQTLVKRGKLGEDYETAGHPFKRPLLMLRAGSCFYDVSPRPYYGRLVKGVHPDFPQVVQYGLALAVSARLPALEAAV